MSIDSEIYTKVRNFLIRIPNNIRISLRHHLINPKRIDPLRNRIKKNIGVVCIVKNGWQYCFLRGEKELNELLKQII